MVLPKCNGLANSSPKWYAFYQWMNEFLEYTFQPELRQYSTNTPYPLTSNINERHTESVEFFTHCVTWIFIFYWCHSNLIGCRFFCGICWPEEQIITINVHLCTNLWTDKQQKNKTRLWKNMVAAYAHCAVTTATAAAMTFISSYPEVPTNREKKIRMWQLLIELN